MYVQASDKKYYRNPLVEFDKWCLTISDEGVFIKRIGSCTWETARKYLRKAGVICKILAVGGSSENIIGGRLVRTTDFQITLQGPIPVPSQYSLCLSRVPLALDGEEVLQWNPSQNSGSKSTKAGRKSKK